MLAAIDIEIIVPVAGMFLALLTLWGAMRTKRLRRLLADLPVSKTIGVFIGLVKVEGTAEAESPVTGYLSGRSCVHYDWSVQERWSRIVTETYTDSQGRTQTRTRTESGWTTVASGGEQIRFYVKDDRGAVRVDPDRAKIEPLTTFSRRCGRGDSLYYAKGPVHAVSHSDHVRQFTERAIPLHADVYIMGTARLREDVVAAEIAYDRDSPIFLISNRPEKSIRTGMAMKYWALVILGALLAVGGWVTMPWIEHEVFPTVIALSAAGGYLVAWKVCWVWTAYNSIARLHQRVSQAWSLIDVELRRRYDLIPQLVNVVSGLRAHEQDVQERIAHLRSQMRASAPDEEGPNPQACLPDVMALAEAYPELKAGEAFLRLQQQLAHTEERIALAREYYNGIAAQFNARLSIIPDRYVARLGRFQPRSFMQAEGFERAEVEVDFAEGQPVAGGADVQDVQETAVEKDG